MNLNISANDFNGVYQMITKKYFVQQLLKIPSNPIFDRVVIRPIIKFYGDDIDSLMSRSGLCFKIGPCSDRALLKLRGSAVLELYENTLLNLLRKSVKNGDVVIDVGANEGYLSIPLAAMVKNSGHIFSIEPHPANISVLKENIRLNNLSNVTVIPKAASDTHGVMKFVGDRAWGTLVHDQITGGVIDIDVDCLDNMIPNELKTSVKLIKIDSEGNEIKVIRGAKNLILLARPIIVFELNLSLLAFVDISIKETFDFLNSNNYKLFKERRGKLVPFEWLDERICNLFALPSELSNKL